jgi:hypothetical protein
MSETNSAPASVQSGSQTSVKLSDLNAVKQQILSRTSVTLTAIGLTAVAAGAVGQLIPSISNAAPGAYPVPVYLAAIILPYAGLRAIRTMELGSGLQRELLARLSSRTGHPDTISPGLQILFVEDIEQDLKSLNVAGRGLIWGFGALWRCLSMRIL